MELQFHPDSAWKRSSNLHETYHCRMYSGKLLMMGREDGRNMWSFITELSLSPTALQPGVGLGLPQEFPPSSPV